MQEKILTIKRNERIADGVFRMELSGEFDETAVPGQFMELRLKDRFLMRPISILDMDEGGVKIIYKVVGSGTEALSRMIPGDRIETLLPLGNGFSVPRDGAGTGENGAAGSGAPRKPLLVGGGIGTPPIFFLAKKMAARGLTPHVVLGFRSADDVLPLAMFESIGVEPIVATEDGSFGIKGLVTDVMETIEYDFDYVYCCGPKPMLRAVYDLAPDGEFSFEERMGCGAGICMGCSIKTKYGYKRVCKDGPVLGKDEIEW